MQAGTQLRPSAFRPVQGPDLTIGTAPRPAIIMKCCICGRLKTENGWEYAFLQAADNTNYSHGFCPACYEVEIRKMKLQTAFAGLALYR